jgi:hypothetical protein
MSPFSACCSQDNVALIAVLEAIEPGTPEANARSRTLICVANTHIHANPELNDVKIWQVRWRRGQLRTRRRLGAAVLRLEQLFLLRAWLAPLRRCTRCSRAWRRSRPGASLHEGL